MNATDNQIKAITHRLGPCMVLAGPGSGKTYTIIHRIIYLLKTGTAAAEHILVVTFARDAADQMRQRFLFEAAREDQALSAEAGKVTFGTFHSIFYRLIRGHSAFKNCSVLSQEEKREMISSLVTPEMTAHIDSKNEFDEYISLLVSEIERGKIFQETRRSGFKTSIEPKEYHFVCNSYEILKNKKGKIDFSDMQLLCLELLKRERRILERWQKQFRFILVDEFQDINPLQFEILNLLAQPENNLFAVGDDDQSIYGFRGSSPEIMMGFRRYYPLSRVILLDVNFRSHALIYESCTHLIRHNSRLDKKICSGLDRGDAPQILCFKSQREQDNWIADTLIQIESSKQAAVLVRTNRQLERLLHAASKLLGKKPGQMGDLNMCKRKMIEDASALVRIMTSGLQSCERKDLIHLLKLCGISVSRSVLGLQIISFYRLIDTYKQVPWMHKELSLLVNDLQNASRMPPYAGMMFIVKKRQYRKYLHEKRWQGISSEECDCMLDTMIAQLKGFSSWIEVEKRLDDINQTFSTECLCAAANIHLMTMHAAKGLEFDIVILPDLVEGITPNNKAGDMQEERRLMYVAMTRARERLIMTVPEEINGRKVSGSRFISEAGLTAAYC